MSTPVPAAGPTTRGPLLVTALVCCAVAALAVTALAVLVAGGGVAWLVSGSPDGIDMAMAGLLVVLGSVFLGAPAACMWVALVRLGTSPPRGARLMVGSLRTVGGFLLTVALPTISVRSAVLATAVVACVGLAFLGAAQLLAAATRSATPQGL